MNKDFYGLLGVDKTAPPDEIKKAYRKLAMESHPDRNPGDVAAEQKFKEASEAYSTLSDPNKRRLYDQRRHIDSTFFSGPGFSSFGDNSNGAQFDLNDILKTFFGHQASHQSRRQHISRDARAEMQISLEEAYCGCQKELPIQRLVWCKTCNGSGQIESTQAATCPVCGGNGNQGFLVCYACSGSGKSNPICTSCGGRGYVEEIVRIRGNLPPKIRNGASVVIKGGGNVLKDGHPGDLRLTISYPLGDEAGGVYVNRHDGRVTKVVKVPWEKILRSNVFKIKVFSLSKKLKVKLDPSKPDGYCYVFPGEGMGTRAELQVQVFFDLPENMSEGNRFKIADAVEEARKNDSSEEGS